MPKKIYRSPREWLPTSESPDERDERAQFGRTQAGLLNWLSPATNDLVGQALLAAAQKQHDLAIGIRRHQSLQGLTTEDLAAYAKVSAGTVRSVLNGSNHADLAILHVLCEAVKLDFRASARPRGDEDTTSA